MAAACYSPAAPFGVPCSDSKECPTGQECDLVDNVCTLPTDVFAWRDDTAAEFSAEGAYLDEVTVEAAGFVGPAAYFTGGLRLSGIDSHAIASSGTTFEDVVGQPLTGFAVIHGSAVDYGAGVPLGLGLSSSNDITVIVEGEIELDAAGVWELELTANDLGFVDLAPPGTNDFVRVVSDDDARSSGTFTVTTPGWHKIRGAFADANQDMSYELRFDSPVVPGGFRSIPSDKLRARVGDLEGLVVDGFEEAFLLAHRGSVVSSDSLADQSFGSNPFGIAVGTGTYTLRRAGQVLIDVEGDYSFRIDSRGGHRAWIDGVEVANVFTVSSEVTVTAPIRLVPGWHDLVVDLNKSGGTAGSRLALTVDSGPALVGQSFPADRMRPVIGRGARWVGDSSSTTLAVPDLGTATRNISFDLPASFAAFRIDAAFEIDHPLLPTMQVVLDPPVGSNLTLAAFGSLTGTGTRFQAAIPPVSDAGSSWNFQVSDNTTDVMTGSLLLAAVTMVGDGGVAPFPTSYRYVSAVRELGEVVAFDVMSWGLRQSSATATATMRIRTCAAAAACESEPWTEVALGTAPSVEPRRFAQYMAELTTNGDVPTALDFVELGYSAYVP